jgi:hypothetical protein
MRERYQAWERTMPAIPEDAGFTLVYGPSTVASASG